MFTAELMRGEKLRLHIGFDEHGKVIVDFGVSLSHVEMEPQEAVMIANLLMKHANNAKMVVQGKTPAQLIDV